MSRKKEDILKDGKNTRFSSTNQPSGELKKQGMKKGRQLREIANQIAGGEALEKSKELAELLGLESDKLTLEMVAHLVQLQKAINKGDTRAYNAVMDRILGKAQQNVNVTSKKPIIVNTFDKDSFEENIKN